MSTLPLDREPFPSAARPKGIGTRTELRLDDHRLVTLTVRSGNLLRSAEGLVWITVDGQAEDILLDRGDVHRVRADGEMRAWAFRPARLEVYGCGPLRFRLDQARTAGQRQVRFLKGLLGALRRAVQRHP